ncbi:hypothetical protein Bca52824_096699 [Brassica carinata]|uniref:Uncharacterized protein n=1 Tax=Brassica carinata TaxID=52824 RepID=A0A8X7NZ38_BRACI|nr:hypothetical protein Bca52824_096699 [Brassica carinata]
MATVTASLRLQPLSSLSSSSSPPPSSRPLYLKLAPPVDNLPHILSAVNFLKSKGISDEDFPRLVYLCPQLFSPTFSISETDPVFDFLAGELGASAAESRGLIVNCPSLPPTIGTRGGGERCGRVPAIFGYSVEDNLRPKFEFLFYDMERDVEELKKFPQYFGFSLGKRIRPRHWHLKKKGVRVSLSRMLMWGDHKFYSKWKP